MTTVNHSRERAPAGPALLVLEDGTLFRGRSVGAPGMQSGEVVFNTALTGYQEILTDPSYARQLVTLTYPHIGNVGATAEDCESRGVFCAGLIVKDVPRAHSNWRAQTDLPGYLRANDVVAISGIDTRKLTRLIRDKGAQRGCIAARQPHGVFLSNGPGDPEPCHYAVVAIGEIVERGIPTFGICLGHQLLALASGAQTEKMKFGHHGANHPVRELDTGRVLITSQNHGFAVRESPLPARLRITHRSLFDGSVQGLERTDKPAFSFQGHPEASPGPRDIRGLFDRFVALMQSRAGDSNSAGA